jgi:hypothetical protein
MSFNRIDAYKMLGSQLFIGVPLINIFKYFELPICQRRFQSVGLNSRH